MAELDEKVSGEMMSDETTTPGEPVAGDGQLQVDSLTEPVPAASPTPTAGADRPATRGVTNPWVLLLVGLLLGGLGGFYLRPLVFAEAKNPAGTGPLAAVDESAPINRPDPHQEVMLAVIAGARHFQGNPDAPVTLVEFGDFNCGYCGRWAAETLPKIDQNYIKTGKVRMAYVHYPILGADSMTAAEGTECAAQQDKFWEYHNKLYASQGIGFTQANLVKLAGELGLDKTAFESCLANFPQASLENDIRLAQVMGVRGTPAFLVNAVPLAGAYPYENFEEVIEAALAGKF